MQDLHHLDILSDLSLGSLHPLVFLDFLSQTFLECTCLCLAIGQLFKQVVLVCNFFPQAKDLFIFDLIAALDDL